MRCPLVTRQPGAGAMQSFCLRNHDCLEAEAPGGQSPARGIKVQPQGVACMGVLFMLAPKFKWKQGLWQKRRKNQIEHGHQFTLVTPGGNIRKDLLFAFAFYLKDDVKEQWAVLDNNGQYFHLIP